MMDPDQLDQLCIDTLRTLSIDAVEKAKSGHPGTPMVAAPVAYCLWQRLGHLKLSNLCWIYDDNRITIEGKAQLAFSEDVIDRFLAYRWHVEHVQDANDLRSLTRSFQSFIETDDRPTLIVVRSHIGYGSPHKQDTREAHGEALGDDEVRLAKQFYGWNPDQHFHVPDGVKEHFNALLGARGATARAVWQQTMDAYRTQFPELAKQIDQMQERDLPAGWDAALPAFEADEKGLATRESSGRVLNAIAARMPWLLGGAAAFRIRRGACDRGRQRTNCAVRQTIIPGRVRFCSNQVRNSFQNRR